MIGEKSPEFNVSNPHPAFGKDDNIKNEFGHTEYPMFVHKFNADGKIVESLVLNSEDDDVPEGFAAVWVKPKAEAPAKSKAKANPFGN